MCYRLIIGVSLNFTKLYDILFCFVALEPIFGITLSCNKKRCLNDK